MEMTAGMKVNELLEREAPALFRALSPLGRRAFAAAEDPARAAHETHPPDLASAFGGLGARDLDAAFHGSPAAGLPEVRRRWREWQRRSAPAGAPSSLPMVTVGLSHGLSLLAELFGGPGKAVAVPQPFWGNYRQAFGMRTGAKLLTAPAYVDGRYNPLALVDALAGLPPGEPAVALLNIPSNPGGYTPDRAERQATVESLLAEAERRPLVVICDDAYAGLVFEPEIPRESPFWDLAGAHPNLIAVKVDGATKEFSFFGGRVGFLTFGAEPESEVARALESKVRLLVRSGVCAPVAASQVILLQALRKEGIEHEIEAVRLLLQGRYRALKGALAEVDPGLLTVLPFNSGCFALVAIPEALGIDAETARRHLLARHDTGLVSIAPRYLRIAHCSVDEAALPELARRLGRGIAELAA
ncbi:MAG TPA: aminotransferase class I/II-fold pyridoxal phosphate-dependent enzyme [Thermoanaerobaculia bacterium]|jgi:aspartate/methionine/tyrosine aminotransferase|nr:aminotransferase class I/II-fold pyridoxal phosphate-dependent enzyme [Thermoanaerobaculia bacterium]